MIQPIRPAPNPVVVPATGNTTTNTHARVEPRS